MRKYWLCVAALVATSLAGSWFVRATAFAQEPNAPPQRYGGFLVGLSLPVPVVQVAPNWYPFLALVIVWSLLGLFGWQAVEALKSDDRARTWMVYSAFAAVGLCLTFFAITQSIDGYYYVFFGRLFGIHGIDPYVLPAPLTVPDKILAQEYPLLHNPPFPDPYGPGFTLLAGVVGRLEAGANLWWQLWTWRVVSLASAVAILAAVDRMLRQTTREDRMRRVAIVAFHPLMLYESGAGGHNDFLMVAAAAWSYALVDDLPLIAGLLLGAAIAIKYFAAVLLPFIVIRAARKSAVAASVIVVLAALVPVLCFHPFNFGATGQATLVKVGSSLSMSLTWLLSLPLFAVNASALTLRLVQLTVVAGFALITLVSLLRYAKAQRNREVIRAIAALIWSLPAMHPWYAAWIAPASAARSGWGTYAWWFAALSLAVYAHEAVLPTPFNHSIFIAITIGVLAVPVAIARVRGTASWLGDKQSG